MIFVFTIGSLYWSSSWWWQPPISGSKLFGSLLRTGLVDLDHSVTNIRIFEYIRIFSATNIRSYHIRILFLIRIYSYICSYHFFDPNIFGYSFVSYFSYHSVLNIRIFEYIRIFSATNIRSYHIRILFLIRIYSDIRSYCFFQYEYIRIFVRIKISYSSHYVLSLNLKLKPSFIFWIWNLKT